MDYPEFSERVLNRAQPISFAMRRIRRIHMVGIGGAGMGGIAEVLLTQGFEITGSDLSNNVMTDRLTKLGAKVFFKHDKLNAVGADVVVTSSAILKDNPEVQYALEHRIPIVPRAEMLAELMRFRYGIAIAGTHGKTTTTSLLTSLLAQANFDPTFVIGGLLNSMGTNAKLGASSYLVAEADESDGSFMLLSPMTTIITNIDKDHLSTYGNDFEQLKKTFIDFAHRLPFYGLVVACMDCPILKALIPQIGRPILTYGFDSEADFKITHYKQTGTRSSFTIESHKLDQPLKCELNLPGRHNALNATASVAVAIEEGVKPEQIIQALNEFAGIGRRFHVFAQPKVKQGDVVFVDDYGHHPAEIQATIDAARAAWPTRKLMMVFQPHRYSRTHELFEDFVEVLSSVDTLFLLEVYSAGEKPIVGADSRALSGAIRARGQIDPIFIPHLDDVADLLMPHLSGNESVLTQGAGDVYQLKEKLNDMLTGLDRQVS